MPAWVASRRTASSTTGFAPPKSNSDGGEAVDVEVLTGLERDQFNALVAAVAE